MAQSGDEQPEVVEQWLEGLHSESASADHGRSSSPVPSIVLAAAPRSTLLDDDTPSTLAGETIVDDDIDDAEFNARLSLSNARSLLYRAEQKVQNREYHAAVDFYGRGLDVALSLPPSHRHSVPILRHVHALARVCLKTQWQATGERLLYFTVQVARDGVETLDDPLLASFQDDLCEVAHRNGYHSITDELFNELHTAGPSSHGHAPGIDDDERQTEHSLDSPNKATDTERSNNITDSTKYKASKPTANVGHFTPTGTTEVSGEDVPLAIENTLLSYILTLRRREPLAFSEASSAISILSVFKPAGLWRFSLAPERAFFARVESNFFDIPIGEPRMPTVPLSLDEYRLLFDTTRDGSAKTRIMTDLFYSAIWKQDLDTIQFLLARGVDVNIRGGPEREHSLRCGLPHTHGCGDPRIHGCKDSQTQEDWTPLTYAAALTKPQLVSWLLEEGADVTALASFTLHKWSSALGKSSAPEWRKLTKNALGWAKKGLCPKWKRNHKDRVTVMSTILRKGGDPNDYGDGSMRNPLDRALYKEKMNLARMLVRHGASLSGRPEDLIQQMLAKPYFFNPEAWDIFAELQTDFAAIPNILDDALDLKVVEYPRWVPAPDNPIYGRFRSQSRCERSKRAIWLFARGVSLSDSPNALRLAILKARVALVKTLHEHGADVNREDSAGRRPLDYVDLARNRAKENIYGVCGNPPGKEPYDEMAQYLKDKGQWRRTQR